MIDVNQLVLNVVNNYGQEQDIDVLMHANKDTLLFGENLDSLGIVFLITDLEQDISDELGVDLALADERAMSQKTSPYRSVKTLSQYIQMLVDEQ